MFDDKAISNADGNSALCTIYAPDPTSDSCRLSSRSMRPAIYLFIMTEITKALFMVHSIIAADRGSGGVYLIAIDIELSSSCLRAASEIFGGRHGDDASDDDGRRGGR